MIYLLYGFGISLISLAKYLARNGIDFVVCDDSSEKLDKAKEMGCKTSAVVDFMLSGSLPNKLIISPGIHLSKSLVVWARENGVPVYNDISLFFEISSRKDHIAVTGSFGKSTCVSIFHEIYNDLSAEKIQLGGNIGFPVFDLDPDKRAILELSAQQLDLCNEISLDIAVILNLCPQHTDWYDTLDMYYGSKLKLLKNARLSIVNCDDLEYVEKNSPQKNIKTLSAKAFSHEIPVRLSEISFVGAYEALRNCGFDDESIMARAVNFRGLAHRNEVVATDPQSQLPTIINDSKSTNLSNTIYLIEKYKSMGDLICIMGGKETNQDLSRLDSYIHSVKLFVTTGSSGVKLNEYLQAKDVNSLYAPTLEEAVSIAFSEKGIILFSPGYPSTDQYQNFMQRGEMFKGLVVPQRQ